MGNKIFHMVLTYFLTSEKHQIWQFEKMQLLSPGLNPHIPQGSDISGIIIKTLTTQSQDHKWIIKCALSQTLNPSRNDATKTKSHIICKVSHH